MAFDGGALAAAIRSASVTREVVVDTNALNRLPGILRALQPGRACRIVADDNTMTAAGARVHAQLRDGGIVAEDPLVLPGTPRLAPRVETARAVAGQLAASGALPIAVGAGVINDVTKYAAELARTPYACVATAASMDGYAASGASMLDHGFKRTLACAPAIAVVADLDVIAQAPARMAAWGYGDLAGKPVAGADWLLADAVGEDALAPMPFALVQDHVRQWLSEPARIAAHDADALRGLTSGLLIAGFAMQAHGNSRPASGSDHQMAHVWEMERLTFDGHPAAHGACVGVGAVAMTALYEWLLAQDVAGAARQADRRDTLDRTRIEAEIDASFAEPELVSSARAEMSAKLAATARRPARLDALAARWDALAARIRDTLLPAATLQRSLRACGAASHPGDLGIPLTKLAADYRRARLIRRRYTVLDCLEDLGWLERGVQAVCATGGFLA